ncbi:MAG: hypothetical protein K0R41_1776 [Geminicoccaceae bacterium]|jgi:Sec-independent protein translocase protein TatA|nr:hypothetical protein [Geminicoccaceae bacterium]MCE3247951.1 hypothetical protein [Geminicoccaceae bacterium]MDF2780434.1 hypothetical protein [Geminicoccaceae bacterium]
MDSFRLTLALVVLAVGPVVLGAGRLPKAMGGLATGSPR